MSALALLQGDVPAGREIREGSGQPISLPFSLNDLLREQRAPC